ncbi:MAG: hypothetical protein ACRCU0_05300 [Candidatus Rhabdochlamydia sp.]
MSLEILRTTFPKTIRTEEQDLIIGDSCLALTEKERYEIENLNFENYQYNSPERAEVCARVTDAIYKAKIMGAASGAAAGTVAASAITWKLTESLGATALAGAGGGLTGAAAGYYAGKKIGNEMVVNDISRSIEYRKWENEKYESIIFPALSRYMDPDRWDRFQIQCPITHDLMLEPVKARDNHIYEKTAILAHLEAWQERWNSWERYTLPRERQMEILQSISPFRSGYISADTLEGLPDYYKNIFKELKTNYNDKVLDQRLVVGLADRVTELSPFDDKIVKFYEKTQRERSIIAADMHTALLRSTLSEEKVEKGREFLSAAAKLPELVK